MQVYMCRPVHPLIFPRCVTDITPNPGRALLRVQKCALVSSHGGPFGKRILLLALVVVLLRAEVDGERVSEYNLES